MGPLIFLIYINDLPQYILSADDTSVLVSAKTQKELEIKSNETLSKLIGWFTDDKLILNFDKTNYIRFSTKNKQINDICIDMHGTPVKNVNSTKLTWGDHVKFIF